MNLRIAKPFLLMTLSACLIVAILGCGKDTTEPSAEGGPGQDSDTTTVPDLELAADMEPMSFELDDTATLPDGALDNLAAWESAKAEVDSGTWIEVSVSQPGLIAKLCDRKTSLPDGVVLVARTGLTEDMALTSGFEVLNLRSGQMQRTLLGSDKTPLPESQETMSCPNCVLARIPEGFTETPWCEVVERALSAES